MYQLIKPYMMPFAIATGILFYTFFSRFAFITPYLIFVMLFFTFSKMQWKKIRSSKQHIWLILIQILGGLAIFGIISPFNNVLAQGLLICIIAPTATAAPVITGMLKGNVESLTAYSLLSNICLALLVPVIFSLVGNVNSVSFFNGIFQIGKNIIMVILSPLVFAFFLKFFLPKVNETISKYSIISFWLWTMALTIVTAKTVKFITLQNAGSYHTEILLAAGALIVCIVLFLIGKLIGRKYNDTIACGQSLGQKNTVLAIWMAQTYLHPLASIAPGMYVLWQNLFNSWQIWRARKILD